MCALFVCERWHFLKDAGDAIYRIARWKIHKSGWFMKHCSKHQNELSLTKLKKCQCHKYFQLYIHTIKSTHYIIGFRILTIIHMDILPGICAKRHFEKWKMNHVFQFILYEIGRCMELLIGLLHIITSYVNVSPGKL